LDSFVFIVTCGNLSIYSDQWNVEPSSNCEINFFNRALIAVLMHILFVTFSSLFVFRLQVDVVGPLLLNASLLLVLMTNYSD